MKRVKTIIKEINNLQRDLYENYTDKQIVQAIEELENEQEIHYGTCIDMIYEGCYNDIVLDNEFKEE